MKLLVSAASAILHDPALVRARALPAQSLGGGIRVPGPKAWVGAKPPSEL